MFQTCFKGLEARRIKARGFAIGMGGLCLKLSSGSVWRAVVISRHAGQVRVKVQGPAVFKAGREASGGRAHGNSRPCSEKYAVERS